MHRRSLSHIMAALERLPHNAEWALWEYLSANDPPGDHWRPRYLRGHGENAELLRAVYTPGGKSQLSFLPREIRHHIEALWIQDHPRACLGPAWYPALCVPGEIPD